MPGRLGFLGLLDQVGILRRFVTPLGIHPVNDALDIVGSLFLDSFRVVGVTVTINDRIDIHM